MDNTNPATKEEFDKKIKEIEAALNALPPEKRLELLKELNAYLIGLSADLDELNQIIKDDNKIKELKSQATASNQE